MTTTPNVPVDQRDDEEPEHHNDRRAFLCWALMLGLVPPERVVERVVAELEERES
jgi:hypothetical protein